MLEPNRSIYTIGDTSNKAGKSSAIYGVGEKGLPGIVGAEAHGEDSRYGMVEGNLPTGTGSDAASSRVIYAPDDPLRTGVKNPRHREK